MTCQQIELDSEALPFQEGVPFKPILRQILMGKCLLVIDMEKKTPMQWDHLGAQLLVPLPPENSHTLEATATVTIILMTDLKYFLINQLLSLLSIKI